MTCQLHQLLADLIPGGAKRALSAAQARALLARVRQRGQAGPPRNPDGPGGKTGQLLTPARQTQTRCRHFGRVTSQTRHQRPCAHSSGEPGHHQSGAHPAAGINAP
jgi:hypothetical protein